MIYTAGLFGWRFSLAAYLASILLGLGGGWLAARLERRGWLANQARFASPAPAMVPANGSSPTANSQTLRLEASRPSLELAAADCACSGQQAPVLEGVAVGGRQTQTFGLRQSAPQPPQTLSKPASVTMGTFLKELVASGRMLLVMFLGFAFIGYFLNGLIPPGWVAGLFGSTNVYNVPIAATLGLPFYINSEASLPLIRTMLDNGMSQGAALAFLIAGSGTSIGAITGALTIARWRVIGLVLVVLWTGAILSGLLFNVVQML
jgi:uncharacterized membrane protein YraQ (UPF0718 family)